MTKDEYPGKRYPDFATGPSYLVSNQAVMDIVPAAMEQKYIHLEDVFLTGVVANKLGIERKNIKEFKNYNYKKVWKRLMGCTLMHTITIHKVDPEEQAELHQKTSRTECGKGIKIRRIYSKHNPQKKALVNKENYANKYDLLYN